MFLESRAEVVQCHHQHQAAEARPASQGSTGTERSLPTQLCTDAVYLGIKSQSMMQGTYYVDVVGISLLCKFSYFFWCMKPCV